MRSKRIRTQVAVVVRNDGLWLVINEQGNVTLRKTTQAEAFRACHKYGYHLTNNTSQLAAAIFAKLTPGWRRSIARQNTTCIQEAV